MKTKSKTVEVYILILAVMNLSIGGIYGGINLINDPSGDSIKLPITMLEGTIFPNFLIPGIILFLLLGFFPLFLIYPLIFKPKWPLIDGMNIYKSYHWAWTYTIYTAIMLIIWIDIQMMILKTGSIIQGGFGLLGVFILVISLMPVTKRYYRIKSSSHHNVKLPA